MRIAALVPIERAEPLQEGGGERLGNRVVFASHEHAQASQGITLGRETLRLWMIKAGLWRDRRQRRKRVYQPRYRRDCVGELVQVDGCEHWWFEDRGRNARYSYSSMMRPVG
jgi:hypothetical protein